MSDRQAGALLTEVVITPSALVGFEEILREWVQENLDCLEEGGLGRSPDLASRVMEWAHHSLSA